MGIVAGGQLIGAVPGEGHHAYARVIDGLYPLQLPGQSRAALYGQQAREFSGLYCCLHIGERAAAGYDILMGFHLPVEAGGVAVEEGDSVVSPLVIGNEDGKALDPFGPGGDFAEGQLESRGIQSFRHILVRGPAIPGQGIAVEIK